MAKKEQANLSDPGLTMDEYAMVLGLVQAKTVKVCHPTEFNTWRQVETKLLDYLSGPGLDLD